MRLDPGLPRRPAEPTARPVPAAARLRSVEVGPLGGEEQRRYLSEARQLGDPELVEAIIRRSGGIPSQLDLLADVVRKQPGITLDEVGGLEGQDLAERLPKA